MNNKDYVGEVYFYIPLVDGMFKIYPHNADVASAHFEGLEVIKNNKKHYCGAV